MDFSNKVSPKPFENIAFHLCEESNYQFGNKVGQSCQNGSF